MKEKKAKTLQGLGDLLPQLSRNRGWQEQLHLHSVFLNWEKLLDSEIATHCKPLKIVRKVLWVEAENSAWLQQFQFQSVHILETINESLHVLKIKGLRFVVAEKEFEEKKEVVLRYVQPPAQEIADFEKQVASISDEDSREALLRFWYVLKACKKG